MLSPSENELITRVGPGTPMGSLMREFWVPALASSELPAADCDPVRVLLLGEQLVAFRDTTGQVGLFQHNCPHRGASLFFGRNEENGLRCVYHGWKFDTSGRCIDMPNEPAESDFRTKVRAVAYPCRERGGIVWAYMGPRPEPPPLPDLEANMLPQDEGYLVVRQRECNWLQALEGDVDTSHFGFLHLGLVEPESADPDTFLRFALNDRAPRYKVVSTDYGAMYGAYRPANPGTTYWRIAHFLFPFFTMPPTNVLGLHVATLAWVPMDDTHTLVFNMGRMRHSSQQNPLGGAGFKGAGDTPLIANTTDWLGRFRLQGNAANDYGIDRQKQRSTDYTGITSIFLQDQAITESEGPVYDRSAEHLCSSDAMIIQVRRRLLRAARSLAETGSAPSAVDQPGLYRVRAGGVVLPDAANWISSTETLRQAFVEHPQLNAAASGGA